MPTPPEPPEPSDYAPTALPSTGARVLAFAAILVGGVCGGLIGYGFTDLQCADGCATLAGFAGLVGAVLGAVGVGVVAILALRAMNEWNQVTGASPGSRPTVARRGAEPPAGEGTAPPSPEQG
jgi:hypothetical protein